MLCRHLVALAQRTGVLDGIGDRCFIDIDSLLRPVYGRAKQGASFGDTKISGKTLLRRGLLPLAVTIGTETAAPMLAGVRLRAGRAASSRGATMPVISAGNWPRTVSKSRSQRSAGTRTRVGCGAACSPVGQRSACLVEVGMASGYPVLAPVEVAGGLRPQQPP